MPYGKEFDVAVVSPSGPVEREHVEISREVIEGAGISVGLAPNVFARIDDRSAGTIGERRSDLVWAMQNSKKIWASVGGYAAMDLAEKNMLQGYGKDKVSLLYLAKSMAQSGIETFGYSDIDIYNGLAAYFRGVATYCMNFGWFHTWADESQQQVIDIHKRGRYPEVDQDVSKWGVIREGVAEGTLLVSGLDTLSYLSLLEKNPIKNHSDVVLFLEENDTYWSSFERQLRSLVNSKGFRKNVRGVVMGRTFGMTDEDYPESYAKVTTLGLCEEILKPSRIPVAVWPEYGHVALTDDKASFFPLGIGRRVRLTIKEPKCKLEYL